MMRAHKGAAVAASFMIAGCASMPDAPAQRVSGWQVPLGNGTATSYAEFDARGAPIALGVVFSPTALDGLTEASDHHHCIDRGSDGAVEAKTRCQHTQESVIPLPDAVARRADVPFKWVLLNWNPHGHIPPGVYDVPHFDVHFMMAPIAEVFAIEPGPCGVEQVRCDQFKVAKKPLPSNYVHADYKDVDAVVPAMGNHLVDLTGPEFNGNKFARAWIYGVYDGRVIFYEEMVTRAHLLSDPNTCQPIKAPAAVGVGGYYPTVSCIRRDPGTGERTVSMEKFVLRERAAPAP